MSRDTMTMTFKAIYVGPPGVTQVSMLSFTPCQQSNDVSRHGVGFSSSVTSVVLRPPQLVHHMPPVLNSAPRPSAQRLHFAVDHRVSTLDTRIDQYRLI
jgi:hypothetical protein